MEAEEVSDGDDGHDSAEDYSPAYDQAVDDLSDDQSLDASYETGIADASGHDGLPDDANWNDPTDGFW